MERSLTVVAMGGNSLIDPKQRPSVEGQFAMAHDAVEPVADLVAQGERLVITHGNGPQVGFMALRSELSRAQLHQVPLDSLVADTQGALGYMVQRSLREVLRLRGVEREVVSVVTEVECDPHDDAFGHPEKPIGLFYGADQVAALERERGWTMMEDAGRGWRRVVPSPAPVSIVQLDTIRRLIDAGVIVVCCGGGGIAVVRDEDGHIRGLEAVIDKDRVSALLGVRLGAGRLFLTTGTDAVYQDFGTPRARRLAHLTLSELRKLIDAGQFPAGSMGPKVEAAARFVMHGGTEAVICSTDALVDAFRGRAGTRITAC